LGAHGNSHHGVRFPRPEIRPLLEDRERVDFRISLPERNQIVGDIAGLLLIVLGGAMMVLAALRFRKTTLDIDAEEVRLGPGTGLDVILATLLFLLGAILFVYLSYTVIIRL